MDQERYRLVDVIGSGGMATVWRAHDTRLGRVVAIKRPHPAPPGSTSLVRFAREARAAAKVSHPNLVSVYDVGEDDTGPYLVMEFVDGPSLAATSVPPHGVARLGAQVASALGVLHEAGIAHGDVKPANILVAHDRVKLTDFGIARTRDDTTALTQEGVIFATPEYAAPETMITGERTAAGDVFALGAVLHELVTGSRWNPATTTTQAMPPAPWMPVLSAMLAQDPDSRPSAVAVGAQLSRLARPGGDAVPAPTSEQDVPVGPVMPNRVEQATHTAAAMSATAPSGHRESGRTAMVVFAGSVLALAVVAGVAAWTNDGTDVIPSTTDVDQSEPVPTVTVLPPTVAPTVPSPTEPPATEPPATEPPATEPPATEPPVTTITPARAQAEYLVDLVAQEMSYGLERNEAIAIVEQLNEALQAAEAGSDNGVEQALRDARRRIERHFDEETRDRTIEELLALGVELGVDPDRLTNGERGPRGDDDDDDD